MELKSAGLRTNNDCRKDFPEFNLSLKFTYAVKTLDCDWSLKQFKCHMLPLLSNLKQNAIQKQNY